MMVENLKNFEAGYFITFQNHRRLPDWRNKHFEEGFGKDLQI
jgi:hypothetical protein